MCMCIETFFWNTFFWILSIHEYLPYRNIFEYLVNSTGSEVVDYFINANKAFLFIFISIVVAPNWLHHSVYIKSVRFDTYEYSSSRIVKDCV